jgi:hypothetical protein
VTVPKEGEEDDEKYIHVFEGKVLQLVEDPKSCPDVTIGKIKFKATAQNHPMALVQWDDVFGCHDSWVPLDLGKYLAEKKRYGWTLLKPDYVGMGSARWTLVLREADSEGNGDGQAQAYFPRLLIT